MENDILIISHLGLGDHIPVNGAVRRLYADKNFNTMYIVVQDQFYKHVSFMYRDLPKVQYIKVPNGSSVFDESVRGQMNNFGGAIYNCWWYQTPNIKYIEENLFTSLGYDWTERYNSFSIPRDYDREQQVYKEIIGDSQEPYIFVADDIKRGYTIDPFKASSLPNNTRVIRSCELLDYFIFDLITIIEKAQETHCMHSAFFTMIECMNLNKIYLHNSYIGKINPIESYGEPMLNWLKERNITHV